MLRPRIIPCLLIHQGGLVKTQRFRDGKYVGDPINAVKIFNEKEVDELLVLDINASRQKEPPNYSLIQEFASECFMPLAYGGGLHDFGTASEIFEIGFEKVVLNVACHTHPKVIEQIAQHFGNQAVVASVDVKRNFWGNYEVFTHSGSKNSKKTFLKRKLR